MHANMTNGANEVHSGYLPLRFISCVDFLCMEHIIHIGKRHGGNSHTDMDGFKMMLTYLTVQIRSILGVWRTISFRGSILLVGGYGT